MEKYQVIARKYRPKQFREVLGQDAVVQTLKNAIKQQRLAQAYLFCGSRGTGKTTLARILAKALNCDQPDSDAEPCASCPSCREIAGGHSLDVLEIDGASHRGIDDIRQINETVGYAASRGKYKIYIIDEVHMLTKEAFNALLKTLEEPPENVKFFFATTEPHKVLPTILSRCQRFQLNRIPNGTIIDKLGAICQDLKVEFQPEALRLIADRAEGGLRDAESLLDQILAFHEGGLTSDAVASVLGVMPRDTYFALDRAGSEKNIAMAFEIAHEVFAQGKDLLHFVQGLTEHFRNLLMVQLGAPIENLSPEEERQYRDSAKLYRQEQCMSLLEYLLQMQEKIRYADSGRIALEAILLHILKSHQRVPVDILVRRLADLEQKLSSQPHPPAVSPAPVAEQPAPTPAPKPAAAPKAAPAPKPAPKPKPKAEAPPPPPKEPPKAPKSPPPKLDASEQSQFDTMMHFAAVELEGTLQKK